MATEQERIEAYRKKIAQLEARAELKENRKKTEATKGLSADDTRRKILLGALVQEEMEKSEGMKQNMIAKLDRFLVRPNDRALFELPIRNVTQ
jgi:AAA+ superfamily predicted ATPase